MTIAPRAPAPAGAASTSASPAAAGSPAPAAVPVAPAPAPAYIAALSRLRQHAATTPGRMQAAALFIALGSFLLWFIVQGSLTDTRSAIQVIGKDAVPSIVAAEKIRAYLADMDANAANGFFSQQTTAASKQYETDRQQVTDALISAAQNITFGDEERVPILAMTATLQQYVGLVEVARSKGYPAGLPLLFQASDRMHKTLLPSAVALDAANFDHLNAAYATARQNGGWLRLRVSGMGLLLLAVLAGAQFFLFQRAHRLLNIPLAAATLLLLVFLAQTLHTLGQEQTLLKQTKQDCFDSIHALWMARAVAFDANGDESLYLLYKDQQRYARQFREKAALLADTPVTDAVIAAAQSQPPTFKGYIGDELRNITFAGEQDAAIAMLRAFGAYLQVDAKIRQMEESGQHDAAVILCTGTHPGQSNYAFDQFDGALGAVLDINQKEFDKDVKAAFQILQWTPLSAAFLSLLIPFAAGYGLHQRIREYY